MSRVLKGLGACLVVLGWSLAVLLVPSSASWANDEPPESSSSSSPSPEPPSSSPEQQSDPDPDPEPDPTPAPAPDPICTPEQPCVMEPSTNTTTLALLLGGVSTMALLGLLVGSFGRR